MILLDPRREKNQAKFEDCIARFVILAVWSCLKPTIDGFDFMIVVLKLCSNHLVAQPKPCFGKEPVSWRTLILLGSSMTTSKPATEPHARSVAPVTTRATCSSVRSVTWCIACCMESSDGRTGVWHLSSIFFSSLENTILNSAPYLLWPWAMDVGFCQAVYDIK